jgi:hypothetical protein
MEDYTKQLLTRFLTGDRTHHPAQIGACADRDVICSILLASSQMLLSDFTNDTNMQKLHIRATPETLVENGVGL